MKKSLTIIAVLLLSFTASAQHTYIHNTEEGDCRQSYNSVVTSDGCIIIDEDIFDGPTASIDVGINFLKINPQDGFVGNLFVDDIIPDLHNMLAKNVNAPDENVYLYFSNDNGTNYHNVLTFTDAMEMTGRTCVPLPIEGDMKWLRYHMMDDGDFIASWHDSTDDTCTRRFARFGLDSSLKTLSEPIAVTGEMPVNNPFFVIEGEPLRIGFLSYDYHKTSYGWSSNGDLYVYVLDQNLQLEQIKTIQKIGPYFLNVSNNVSVTNLDDGFFAIMTWRDNLDGNSNKYRVIGKYDRNLNFVKYHQIQVLAEADYPQPIAYDADNNALYAIWYDTSQYGLSGFKTHLRCIDASNMTMIWEKECIKGIDGNIINTLRVMDDNTVALSGFMSYKGSSSFFDSYAFAVFVENSDGVDDNVMPDSPFTCHPNPAKDVISISFAENMGCNSIAIYSIDGRLVKSQNFNSGTIDVSGLSSGVYVMKVRMSDGSEFTERIIKE